MSDPGPSNRTRNCPTTCKPSIITKSQPESAFGGNQFFRQMAPDKMPRPDFFKPWHGRFANLRGMRTAGMKIAAGRRIGWAGNFALQWNHSRLLARISLWHSPHQCRRIGMHRSVKQRFARRQFDNFSQIHHDHPITKMLHNTQIMGHEQIRQIQIPLQVVASGSGPAPVPIRQAPTPVHPPPQVLDCDAKARAMAMRWRWPPLKACGKRCMYSGLSPTNCSNSATRLVRSSRFFHATNH